MRAATIVTGDGVLADGLLTARTAKDGALVNVFKFCYKEKKNPLIMMKKSFFLKGKKILFLDVYGLIFMCRHGLHTHASSVRVAGKVLDARTAETADSVGTSRIGATRFTQAFVNV